MPAITAPKQSKTMERPSEGGALSSAAVSIASRSLRLGVVERPEIVFVALFTLALCVVTTLPYVVGHLKQFPGTVFTDVLEHSLDSNNYLAYAHQAAEGQWLFRNPMTGEAHRAVFFNIEWLVIGKISSLTRSSLGFAMNIVRLLCLILMCCGVYWLASFAFDRVLLRRIALVGIMAGGGFGWIVALHLFHIPINSDYFIDLTNGMFPFYWALKLPHFLVSESFVVLSMCFFLRAEMTSRTRDSVASGICCLTAGMCRPYDMLFMMASIAVFLALSFWSERSFSLTTVRRALPVLMCMPLLGYYFWIFKIHPIFRWWSVFGRPGPAEWLLAFGFGMSSILFVISIWRLSRIELNQATRFMFCCLASAIILAHTHHWLHFAFQFATNIYVPLVMVILAGLAEPILKWRATHRWASASIVAILILNSFTSIALAGQAAVLVHRGDFRADVNLLEAYSWLDAHSHRADVVLANFELSNQMPQYTRDSVFCGYVNTVNLDNKAKELQRFLDPKTSNEYREHLLRENRIAYVLLTPAEASRLPGLDQTSSLKEVFRNNAAVIFAVMDESSRLKTWELTTTVAMQS